MFRPTPLNKAIKRQHCALPSFEDIVSKVASAKYLFILDARSGYWHIMLDSKSSDLTVFNTILGKYRFFKNAVLIERIKRHFLARNRRSCSRNSQLRHNY